MDIRTRVSKSSTWVVVLVVAMGLWLVTRVALADPQGIRPEATVADPGQIRSLQSSVAALRSQVESLERANRELAQKLDELARQRPGDRGGDGTGLGAPTPGQVDEVREGLRTSDEVMRIVEPRLAALRERMAALEKRHEGHAHQYISPPSMGWATWTNIQDFGDTCPGCLLPFKSPEKARPGGSGYLETSGPSE